MNAQIEKLFECQRLIRVQRYAEALKMIEDVKKITPQLSASYEFEGGIYYLQGKKSEALDAYRAAARLNPKSLEAVRMRDTIESSIGGRMPASNPGVKGK